jgi:hypothetical protein
MKNIYKGILVITVAYILGGCNTNTTQQTTTEHKDSVKSNITPPDAWVSKLLTHFKEYDKFPVVIDSVYICNIDHCLQNYYQYDMVIDSAFNANLDKNDSLGDSDVRLLVKKWFSDSLVSDNDMRDFYSIDSAKKLHVYEKWADTRDIGMVEFASAYGLRKIKMNDSLTLLVWAYSSCTYQACPCFAGTSIYFTMLNGNTIGETFTIGDYSSGADVPNMMQAILAGKLDKDGKLVLDEKIFHEDSDSLKGTVEHTHYEYAITYNTIKQLLKSAMLKSLLRLKRINKRDGFWY